MGKPKRKPRGYWTKEKCRKEALKYTSRKKFALGSGSACVVAKRKKWMDEICQHMNEKYYDWTCESCAKEALKYNSRSSFQRQSGGAYNYARKKKILDNICSHMKYIGNRFMRLVYVYEFSDNYIYVGLTHDIDERHKKRQLDSGDAVYKHIKKTGLIPKLTFSKYMHVDKAKKMENDTVEKYKKDGYTILNIAKTGAVGGGNLIWTFENCQKEALKYKTRTEFALKNNSAYNAVRRYGWIDKICSHMIQNRKPSGYWTKDKCHKEAKKYNYKKEFENKSKTAYTKSLRNNWLNEFCSHMSRPIRNKK